MGVNLPVNENGLRAEFPGRGTSSLLDLSAPANVFTEFQLRKGFAFDDYQIAACQALVDGKSVLVAAPTGAGKTVVGEFAIQLAVNAGGKAFYTTPIKALSNQKYHDLVALFGLERVGLLTGDTSINATAEILVMTTEVLRNMLYVGSELLTGLQYVVVDEVHYLADRFRGPVWEEVIIHLPEHVALVALSATVSNAEEFGEWLATVRSPMISTSNSISITGAPSVEIIVSEHRPVPLFAHVAVAGSNPRALPRLLDLYASNSSDSRKPNSKYNGTTDTNTRGGSTPLANSSTVSSDLIRLLTPLSKDRKLHSNRGGGDYRRRNHRGGYENGHRTERGSHSGHQSERNNALSKQEAKTPATRNERPGFRRVLRSGLIAALDQDGLLPAIYFIFSRSGCDAALDQLYRSGIRLTTPAQQAQISTIIEQRVADISSADLETLGYWQWRSCLERGIAAHHAGMLPVFKETVEVLFKLGLIIVVFATETLALGINMPARTVVLEKLDKWDGVAHKELTPGEFTQLTGRAGRRGIDVEGHAVIVDHPGLDPQYLATLATKRTYPLMSAFKPTYNMSINLVAQVGYDRALAILETSFAQFQADRSAVGLARQIQTQEQALTGYSAAMACERGDFSQYLRLRRELTDYEKQGAKAAKAVLRHDTEATIKTLKRGDIISVPTGKRKGYSVVVEPASFSRPPLILTQDKQARPLVPADAPRGLKIIGEIPRFPKGFNHRRPDSRADLAATLRGTIKQFPVQPPAPRSSQALDKAKIATLREQIRDHPCANCPDLAEHERWGQRYQQLDREYRKLENRLASQTGTVARVFKRVCQVLSSLGYLTPEYTVTDDGQWLRRIYLEQDILLAECVRRGAWAHLDAAGLAAVVSALVYESSKETEFAIPLSLTKAVSQAMQRTEQIWQELTAVASEHRLDPPRPLAQGLMEPIFQWTNGATLTNVLRHSELAPGDFVRWCKQVVDVLNQLANVAPTKGLRNSARQAVNRIMRGVVTYSALDTPPDTPGEMEHMFDSDGYAMELLDSSLAPLALEI